MSNFETEIHTKKNCKFSHNSKLENIEENDRNWMYDFRVLKKFVAKKFCKLFTLKKKRNFKQILFITLDTPPIDYILAFQKQYPDKSFKVLMPINHTEGLKYTNICFEFFLQNRIQTVYLYKYPKTRDNIEIFGLYSNAYSNQDRMHLQYLAPFIKAARMCAKEFQPDIIHADNIPFFMGEEFETKKLCTSKVVLVIKDFSIFEKNKTEAFWTAINIVDQNGMKKICQDKIIKKCIASLFKLHNTKKFYQMRECLEFIYLNYPKFRRYIDKCEDIEENILFNRMNARILQLFPHFTCEDDIFYNSMYNSLKKTNFWAVISKTYYNNLLEDPSLSGKIYKKILKTKSKSSFVSYGYTPKNKRIYQAFNTETFRELRHKNKTYILKEFSKERIQTKFLDINLFRNEDFAVHGYLDSFYEAPLIFIQGEPNEIYSQGLDIIFNTIFKLFELNKNVQVIINIPNGLNNNYIKTRISFLEKNYSYNGRWLFIDGELNKEQFFASSDMIFLPARNNPTSNEHYIAMKYGCIPITSRVGIYNDTISDIFDDITYGCGFKTKTTLDTEDDANEIYLKTVFKALNLYTQNPSSWNLLIKNAINYDSDWRFDTIEKYNNIYETVS